MGISVETWAAEVRHNREVFCPAVPDHILLPSIKQRISSKRLETLQQTPLPPGVLSVEQYLQHLAVVFRPQVDAFLSHIEGLKAPIKGNKGTCMGIFKKIKQAFVTFDVKPYSGMAELTPLLQCFPGRTKDIRNGLRTLEDKIVSNGEQLGMAHLQQICQELDADADCQSRQEATPSADKQQQQQQQPAASSAPAAPRRYPTRDRRPPSRYGYDEGDFQASASAPMHAADHLGQTGSNPFADPSDFGHGYGPPNGRGAGRGPHRGRTPSRHPWAGRGSSSRAPDSSQDHHGGFQPAFLHNSLTLSTCSLPSAPPLLSLNGSIPVASNSSGCSSSSSSRGGNDSAASKMINDSTFAFGVSAQRRPTRAEQHVPAVDQTPGPSRDVPAARPAVQQEQRQSAASTTLDSAAAKLGRVPVGMSLLELVRLCLSEQFIEFAAQLSLFFSERGITTTPAEVQRLVQRYQPLINSALQVSPDQPGPAQVALVCAIETMLREASTSGTPLLSSSSSSGGSSSCASASPPLPTPLSNTPVADLRLSSSGGITPAEAYAPTYVERLASVQTYTASMPYVLGSYDPSTDPSTHRDSFFLDIGSGGNVMTASEFEKQRAVLQRVGAKLYNIEPVKIGLYDEGATVMCRQLVVGVPVTLGSGVYKADFFIGESGCFPAILGHNFCVQYDLMPRTRHGDCLINIKPAWVRPGGSMPQAPYWAHHMGARYTPKQRLPVYWDGRQLTVRVARR